MTKKDSRIGTCVKGKNSPTATVFQKYVSIQICIDIIVVYNMNLDKEFLNNWLCKSILMIDVQRIQAKEQVRNIQITTETCSTTNLKTDHTRKIRN